MDGVTSDQIQAIAEEASKKGIKVTGIARSPQELMSRVKAGMQGVDHMVSLFGPGNVLDPEAIKVLYEARASVVPTLLGGGQRQMRALEWPDNYVNNRLMALWTPAGHLGRDSQLARTPRAPAVFRGRGACQGGAGSGTPFQTVVGFRRPCAGRHRTGGAYLLPTESMWEEMDLMVATVRRPWM